MLGIAAVVGALLVFILGVSVIEGSGGPHGYGYVLPVIGLVALVLPGALMGWGLVADARRERRG